MGSLILEQADASGLLYRRNRYYDPASGRFTQHDPIGLAGGLNLYAFGGGDPVNLRDPMGTSAAIDRANQQEEQRSWIWRRCQGEQLCQNLVEHYESGKGGIYRLSQQQFSQVASVASGDERAKVLALSRTVFLGEDAWRKTVSFYGTELENALGTATLFYDMKGNATGFFDVYNFDKRPFFGADSRPTIRGELKTRGVRFMSAAGSVGFEIRFP